VLDGEESFDGSLGAGPCLAGRGKSSIDEAGWEVTLGIGGFVGVIPAPRGELLTGRAGCLAILGGEGLK